jgi:hypothetical protein
MFEISMLNNFGKRLMCDIIEQFLIVEVHTVTSHGNTKQENKQSSTKHYTQN